MSVCKSEFKIVYAAVILNISLVMNILSVPWQAKALQNNFLVNYLEVMYYLRSICYIAPAKTVTFSG